MGYVRTNISNTSMVRLVESEPCIQTEAVPLYMDFHLSGRCKVNFGYITTPPHEISSVKHFLNSIWLQVKLCDKIISSWPLNFSSRFEAISRLDLKFGLQLHDLHITSHLTQWFSVLVFSCPTRFRWRDYDSVPPPHYYSLFRWDYKCGRCLYIYIICV